MRKGEQNQAAGGSLKEGKIFCKLVNIPYTALVAAATGQTISIDDALPDDAVVLGAFWDLITDFAAPVASALALDVGISGNTDLLIDNQELLASSPVNTRAQTLNGDTSTHAYVAGKQISAVFTATGANHGNGTVTAYTAGEVEIGILYTRIGRIGVNPR